MSREVYISHTVEVELRALFAYLLSHWPLEDERDFIKKLDKEIALIKDDPEGFPESEKEKGLRKCAVTEHTTLYYRFDSESIDIISIFDTRKHSGKL